MTPLLYSNRPLIACPTCQQAKGRFLSELSHGSLKDYYRCDQCGEVWTVAKIAFTPPITARLKPDRRRTPRTLSA